MEAAFRQYQGWGDTPVDIHRLVAASHYLAAHSPTIRSQAQIYQIAYQLHWGDRLREQTE